MQSSAKNVSEYLEEIPAERKPALARLRSLCQDILTGFEESMQYGGPAYSRDGKIEVGFASQKNFIALYILKKDALDQYREQLMSKGVSLGKGCIRFSRPERINFELVEKLLISARESTGEICE